MTLAQRIKGGLGRLGYVLATPVRDALSWGQTVRSLFVRRQYLWEIPLPPLPPQTVDVTPVPVDVEPPPPSELRRILAAITYDDSTPPVARVDLKKLRQSAPCRGPFAQPQGETVKPTPQYGPSFRHLITEAD